MERQIKSAPIVLFVFKRLDHVTQVVEALKKKSALCRERTVYLRGWREKRGGSQRGLGSAGVLQTDYRFFTGAS